MNGFTCVTVLLQASRTFVHEDVYDNFVEKAAAKAKSYKIGNTLDPGTHIGAQVR
jgi:acyl-CoA reductase-like NAD-dependent aldehyde dehydrogenase